MKLKRIDRLLIKSFIPPFFLATAIALFVLIMQTLWLYIDDILGKGTGVFIVLEFLFYLSMSLVPLSLPVGVLLASVMVIGALAERYELSSIKSAGISLFRVMRPLIFLCAGIAVFSFVCYEYVIPVSNLKFKSRLYDMRKQKPALSLDEMVFNDDFHGYKIRIGKKESDGRNIRDVLIYDEQGIQYDQMKMISAKSGEMYMTDDQKFFVMKLKDGYHYLEDKGESSRDNDAVFITTKFDTWTKYFDLSEFELNRTDEELFKAHQTMKNRKQLKASADTLTVKIERQLERVQAQFAGVLPQPDTVATQDSTAQQAKERRLSTHEEYLADPGIKRADDYNLNNTVNWASTLSNSTLESFLPRSQAVLRSYRDKLESAGKNYDYMMERRAKHIFEMNTKISFSLICLVFLFIGAPMGAIVRKGGFGYPLLVAVIFFILFIMVNTFCQKLAEAYTIKATLAAWIPVLIFVPVSIYITYRAMNDSKILDVDAFWSFLRKRKKGVKA